LNEDLLFAKHLGQQVYIAKLLGEEETLHQPPLTTSTHYKAIRRRSSCHPHSTKVPTNKAMRRMSLIFITQIGQNTDNKTRKHSSSPKHF